MADNNYEIDVTLEETFGTGVRSVEQTATSAESGGMNEITVTLTNDQENKFYIMNGLAGKDGRDGGFPVAVGEASLMTDTSKIYLYVGIEEGYTQNHLYYWDGEAWHDYGTYGAPADYLRSASVTHGQGLDQLGNTTYTADTLTLEGNADGSPVETEFVQKLYYSAGENVDGALTQKATSEAIESAQYLPIVNHPNAPVGDTALSVELQQNVMNVIGGVGYAFTTITMTLATKKAGRVNRYFGRFTTGGNAFAVTWPTGVTVPSALSYKTQTTYDFVIEDSILHVWEDGNAVGDVLDATATANAVSTWLTNHPEATTTVADGSITTVKLASGVIDSTLTVQGTAADAKKTGDEISDLKSQISQNSGIPYPVKLALYTILQNVGFKNTEVYSDELSVINEWVSGDSPVSLTAVFNQGSNVIYPSDSLSYLRQFLTVTASYMSGTTRVIEGYELGGQLTGGTCTITVSYGEVSTTFNVAVSTDILYKLRSEFTSSDSAYIDTNVLPVAGGTYSVAGDFVFNSFPKGSTVYFICGNRGGDSLVYAALQASYYAAGSSKGMWLFGYGKQWDNDAKGLIAVGDRVRFVSVFDVDTETFNISIFNITQNKTVTDSHTYDTSGYAVGGHPIYIGSNGGSNKGFDGTVKDFNIYNRAMTSAEITTYLNG